jgi:transcription initiation factor TFIID TATA-box-binding protein
LGRKTKIQNIVLSVAYEGIEFDIKKLARVLNGTVYNPKVFPGMAYRSEFPRASFLIFKSGKMNCVGAKNMKDAKLAIKNLTRKLRRSGVSIKTEPKIVVQNIVASIDFGRRFDLEEIARNFETTEYEPEVFPGLVFRLDDPKVVVLLFVSGKGVCAGAKNRKDVERAVEGLLKLRLPGG